MADCKGEISKRLIAEQKLEDFERDNLALKEKFETYYSNSIEQKKQYDKLTDMLQAANAEKRDLKNKLEAMRLYLKSLKK